MQGRRRGKRKSMPKIGQGSRIRAQNGEGQVGLRCGVPKMETKVVEGRDVWWKILEGAWVVGTRESEFQCYTVCNNTTFGLGFE